MLMKKSPRHEVYSLWKSKTWNGQCPMNAIFYPTYKMFFRIPLTYSWWHLSCLLVYMYDTAVIRLSGFIWCHLRSDYYPVTNVLTQTLTGSCLSLFGYNSVSGTSISHSPSQRYGNVSFPVSSTGLLPLKFSPNNYTRNSVFCGS